MNYDGYTTILVEKTADMVATITINRPEALNSFNRKMCLEFHDVWQKVREDKDVNAIVVRGAPGRAFCAGVDVRDPDSPKVMMYDDVFAKVNPGEFLGPKQHRLWKPVIVAVHGICAGGAFYWLNDADIVICSEDATFFDPHCTFGMVASVEPVGLRHLVPAQEVLRMVLLGNDERICAATALRISLVTEVVKLENLWARAHELAAKIAAKPSVAVQGSVRAIWESMDLGRTIGLQMSLSYMLACDDGGTLEVDRNAVMGKAQPFEVR